jgi:hypothetical protein
MPGDPAMGSWLHQVTVLVLGYKLTSISLQNIHTRAKFLCFLAVVTKMSALPNGFKTVPTHSVRKNGCGNCGVSDPVEDRNCLRELVVGTWLSLSIL